MCLGIPGKITQVWNTQETNLPMAKVDFGGIGKEICLTFTPEAQVGDYVMVHVGFAISCIDEEEAQHTLQVWSQIGELGLENGDQRLGIGEHSRKSPINQSLIAVMK